MFLKTHLKINKKLCGEPLKIGNGSAEVKLVTSQEMVVDRYGLIHGGFIFGLADYSAMLAVNHPNVVLASAEVKFLKPVKIGEVLLAKAEIKASRGRRKVVKVEVERGNEKVFEGEFICIVTKKHVLKN